MIYLRLFNQLHFAANPLITLIVKLKLDYLSKHITGCLDIFQTFFIQIFRTIQVTRKLNVDGFLRVWSLKQGLSVQPRLDMNSCVIFLSQHSKDQGTELWVTMPSILDRYFFKSSFKEVLLLFTVCSYFCMFGFLFIFAESILQHSPQSIKRYQNNVIKVAMV